MSFLSLQQDVAILFYATLGKQADSETLNFFARQLDLGQYNKGQLADKFIRSQDGHQRYDGLTTAQKIQYIYKNTTGESPSSNLLATLVAQVNAGQSLGQLTKDLIGGVKSYTGSDAHQIGQQQHLFEVIETTLYPALSPYPANAAAAADIQAMFYVVGSLIAADGVNYWSSILAEGKASANYIAGRFVDTRSGLKELSNEEFVKTVYKNTFGVEAGASEIASYVAGLNNNTETRGDVLMRLITDIRNDTTHDTAKQNFQNATHVYAAGELPALNYQETVALLFLQLAKNTTLNASGLDSFSKFLASGKSDLDLLTLLAKSTHFQDATNFAKVYTKLYGTTLNDLQKQAILQQAGNNPLQATLNIIDTFRHGEAPLDSGPVPSIDDMVNVEYKIGSELGYQIRGNLTLSNTDGTLTGTLNSGAQHTLSHAEIAQLLQITLNVDVGVAVDLSFAKSLQQVSLQGDFAASLATLNSLKSKSVTLYLTDNNVANTAGLVEFTNGQNSSILTDQLNVATTHAQLNLYGDSEIRLLWKGNAIPGESNKVSSDFTATLTSTQYVSSFGVVSANFITKDVLLTSASGGSVDGVIQSNLNQFLHFQLVDLANYRGTANIYLDGKLVATESTNVFDAGLLNQTASIYNERYADVSSLIQADAAQKDSTGTIWTGSRGFNLSGFADNVHVINVSLSDTPTLRISDNASSKSKVHLETINGSEAPHWGIAIGNSKTSTVDGGTVSLTSHSTAISGETLFIASVGTSNNILTLAGGGTHVETLELFGSTALNLTIKANFSDSLKNIVIPVIEDPWSNPPIITANLTLEKGGTGGGQFYQLLQSLSNHSAYDGLIDQLSGDQLTIAYTATNSFSIQGNTTLTRYQGGDPYSGSNKISFDSSSIDSMVTIEKLETSDTIFVGKGADQWKFGSHTSQTMAVYGSVSKPTAVDALFNSLTVGSEDNGQDIFAKALDKITNGASKSSLAEVGAVKIGSNVYVVIDNNHNQQFDQDDSVFSLGDKDVYQIAGNVHYQAPSVTLNGIDQGVDEAIVA
ncbi:ABC-type protease/lipase transport system, ATPase and permease components [Serratia plymuthica]|nr:ABC-type protease/lipase transport system, ATPase and permease components [Serratia plymuthica]